MADSEQQLFLMEFLVDNVKIPSVHAMHTEMLPVTTCVAFQILNLPRINIYQESSSENCACVEGDARVFKKGKSCLFALPTIVLEKPLHTFPITMSVYEQLPPGVLPDVMLIGSHEIETKDLINALLNRHVFRSGNPYKTMKDTFKITTVTGQHVGEVTVFIRISCFGKKIVTQFQIPHNKKPYLFKGADDSPVFQCKRIPSNLEERVSPMKCNCDPSKLRSDNLKSVKAPRTCCPPPPCPPPTRRHPSPVNLASRPCCPSSRGEQCSSALKSIAHQDKNSRTPQREKYEQSHRGDNRGCFQN